jgi:hypothetical protein
VQEVGGQGIEADIVHLRDLWQVPQSEIFWFSNRDTVVTEQDTSRSELMIGGPEFRWLYHPADSLEAASQMCQGLVDCRAVTIEGAAAEAARLGSSIVVLQVFPGDFPADSLDTELTNARLIRPTIYLTARPVPGTLPGEIVMFATGVTDPTELDNLCNTHPRCDQVQP